MTVCIAALAEHNKKAIVLADRMITARIPVAFEYETDDVKKIYMLARNIYGLSAGDALHAYKIISNTERQIRRRLNIDDPTTIAVEDVASILRTEYQNYRRTIVVEKFIETRGMTLASYYEAQQKLNQRIIHDIDEALTTYDINVDFIVAGLGGDKECHIYTITHPGTVMNNDALGYVSVGSGGPHAMYYIIGSDYRKDKSLKEIQKIVEGAKKLAEKAPGVGEHTTIKIIPDEIK